MGMQIKAYDKWHDFMLDVEEDIAFSEKFNKEKFCDAIKEVFFYFFKGKNRESYDRIDVQLYGLVYSYGKIIDLLNPDDEEFEASRYIAITVAEAFVHPEIVEIGENSITNCYYPDGPMYVTYDFEKKDFSEYIALVKKMNE